MKQKNGPELLIVEDGAYAPPSWEKSPNIVDSRLEELPPELERRKRALKTAIKAYEEDMRGGEISLETLRSKRDILAANTGVGTVIRFYRLSKRDIEAGRPAVTQFVITGAGPSSYQYKGDFDYQGASPRQGGEKLLEVVHDKNRVVIFLEKIVPGIQPLGLEVIGFGEDYLVFAEAPSLDGELIVDEIQDKIRSLLR